MSGYEVKLKWDRSRYQASFTAGAIGRVDLDADEIRAAIKRNALVRVAIGDKWDDVRMRDLEVIDPRWKSLLAQAKNEFEEAIEKNVKSAVLRLTRRGGFKELVIEF